MTKIAQHSESIGEQRGGKIRGKLTFKLEKNNEGKVKTILEGPPALK